MLQNGRKINVSQLRHKFRKPAELYGGMGLIIIPEILPEIQKRLNLCDHDITVRIAASKSKTCPDKEKYKNYFDATRQLSTFAHFQYLAILRGEKQKTPFF